jgi:hypothetical protein
LKTLLPKDFVQSGSFQGTGTPPVIMPGQSVSFKFSAGKTQALCLPPCMALQKIGSLPLNSQASSSSNNGNAITGDVSSSVLLWDNGTKDNMTGQPESKPIMQVPNVNASQLMKLTLTYNDATSEFTLTIMKLRRNN